MSGYISSILVIAVVGGIVTSLVSSSKLKKHISYLIGLASTLVLLSPIATIFSSIDTIKENIESFINNTLTSDALNNTNSLIVTTGIDKISQGIKEVIINKYKFDENEVQIDIKTDSTDITSIKITQICITLTGKATWTDADNIEKTIEDYVGCNVIVKKK